MAKIKVRPQPGRLSNLLRQKAMTQLDAHAATGLDRKTLRKIDRGEEVKREILQQLATKLRVPESYFLDSTAGQVAKDDDALPVLEPGEIMLRKLTVERLATMLKGVSRIRWELNAQIGDSTAHKMLEDFETTVEAFRQQVNGDHEDQAGSLRFQLRRLETQEQILTRLEMLAKHRLTVLGAEYLFWECSGDDDSMYDGRPWISACHYTSSRIVLLSVEPSITPSRRTEVSQGSVPPRFADKSPTYVDGKRLVTEEEEKEMRASPLAWAFAFAKAGIDVAPAFEIVDGHCGCLNQNCEKPGKHPLFQEDWKRGTRAPAEIREWWRRRPTANLMAHTGRRSQLVVIDVDVRRDGMKYFRQLSHRFPELFETFCVATGSGGIHVYLRSDESWRSGMDLVGPGIDLRGESGYVIGPGSKHVSGTYQAPPDTDPILTMSDGLREYLVGIGAAEEKAHAH
jgi:transcriptional regulator with XRE-family HTH domain